MKCLRVTFEDSRPFMRIGTTSFLYGLYWNSLYGSLFNYCGYNNGRLLLGTDFVNSNPFTMVIRSFSNNLPNGFSREGSSNSVDVFWDNFNNPVRWIG